MDPVVLDLLKGPASAEPPARLAWLKKAHYSVASATEPALSAMAEPLQQAIELSEKIEKAAENEQEGGEAVLLGLLLKVQGLALYSYLTELNKMRNAIAAEAKKYKPGSEEKKKAEALQGAYEMALDGLGKAYNGLRTGNFEEMQNIGPVMDQVRKAADELRK